MCHDAGYFREEPGAGKPPARTYEGGAKWPSYSTIISSGMLEHVFLAEIF